MKRQMPWALVAGGIALAASTATAAPAAAATSGSESVKGIIVTSGVSGTRTVITSAVVTKGMLSAPAESSRSRTCPPTSTPSAGTTSSSPATASTSSARTWTSRSPSTRAAACPLSRSSQPGNSPATSGSSPPRPAGSDDCMVFGQHLAQRSSPSSAGRRVEPTMSVKLSAWWRGVTSMQRKRSPQPRRTRHPAGGRRSTAPMTRRAP